MFSIVPYQSDDSLLQRRFFYGHPSRASVAVAAVGVHLKWFKPTHKQDTLQTALRADGGGGGMRARPRCQERGGNNEYCTGLLPAQHVNWYSAAAAAATTRFSPSLRRRSLGSMSATDDVAEEAAAAAAVGRMRLGGGKRNKNKNCVQQKRNG
ncbi:hypothetical protein ACI65C_003523 [Semiaphis heraclei]